jgi:hypothetical protein
VLCLQRGHKRTASPLITCTSGTRMNRLLSFFKRRLSRPSSTSFFSTNSPRLAQALQSDMPSASYTSSSETFGDFDLINRVKLDFSDIMVSSWRSRVTGLNVVHLDYEGERIAAAVSHPSSSVHRLYSINSSYREWLFCSGHRKYAKLAFRESVLCLTIRSFQ